MKRISWAAIAVVVGIVSFSALSSSPPPVRAGATLVVDDDGRGSASDCDSSDVAYSTIQAAIAGATADDTISVCPGTYVEIGQIVISKHLSIAGAGASTTVVKPAGDTGSLGDARGWFLVKSGITFNLSGVTLDGTGRKVFQAIRHLGRGTISDCAFSNIKYPGYNGIGIAAMGPTGMNVDVTDCTFTEIGRIGVIYFGAGVTGTFSGNTYTGKGDGDWLDYGVEVGGGAHATISNSTISDCLGVASDSSVSGGILVSTLYGAGTEASITGNTFTNNYWGIGVGYGPTDTSVVVAHLNNISGNTHLGLRSSNPTVDATGNWWGSDSGPTHTLNPGGTGDAVSDNVAYSPWLGIGTDTNGDDPGFQPASPMTYEVEPQVCLPVGCIQQGVNLASNGDTIQVKTGTYNEQVEIAKDLTLKGAGSSTIIQSPDKLTKKFTTSADNYPVVYIHDAEDVTVRDLVVDGAGKGNANYRFYGIAFRNAGGKVSGCEIKDVRDTPFSGAQHGVAIYAYNDDSTGRTVDVSDNVITGFQKNAIALNAGDTTPLAVNVEGNQVTGYGPTTITAQNGIQVWADMGDGTVDGNTVTGIAYDNTDSSTKWVATSILNIYADLDITGNIISDAHMGVYNIDGAGQISGNDVAIEKVGVFAYGIVATDPPGAVPSPFDAVEPATGGPSILAGAPLLLGATPLAVGVSNNEVTFSGADNTSTYGIEADAGWEGTDDLAFTANNNIVTGFEVGVGLYACESDCDTGVFTGIEARYNKIAGNTIGMESNVTYLTADATGNWWGDASGPHNDTNNADGAGNAVSDNVAYSPWLGIGDDASSGVIGFQPKSPMTFIVEPQVCLPVGCIQQGVNLASGGDTIQVKAGTYVEPGQIVIGENLTIAGAGASTTVVKPAGDTGSSGAARGWFLVNSGVTFNLSGVTLDGTTGRNIYQAIRHLGRGTISNCAFSNIKYPGYQGTGIAVMGPTGMNVDVTDCTFTEIGRIGVIYFGAGVTGTFSGNTYTGKGLGNWLDYGVEVGGGAHATITGNTISGNTGVASSDGSTSAGIIATTYYGEGTQATIIGNEISGCTDGIGVGYLTSDTSVVTAHLNLITGNTTGVDSTAPIVDALSNWWGHATGPYHATKNPTGLGNKVSDYVLFDPWVKEIEYVGDTSIPLGGTANLRARFVNSSGTTPLVAGVTVHFDLAHSGGASVPGSPFSALTDGSGVASVPVTGLGIGLYTVTARWDPLEDSTNLTVSGTDDSDGDGVLNAADNCPTVYNPDQLNSDGGRRPNGARIPGQWASNPARDKLGDACDPDDDNDALPDTSENELVCPFRLVGDSDGDRVLDGFEVATSYAPCSAASKPPWGVGSDSDGDGLVDWTERGGYNTCAFTGDTFPGWSTCTAPKDSDGDACADTVEVLDLNGDRTADSGDQGLMNRRVAGKILADDPVSESVFDLNKDGDVDSGDQGLMNRNTCMLNRNQLGCPVCPPE